MDEIKRMQQLAGLLTEDNDEESILVPRRTGDERKKNHLIAVNKQIQQYIKNGSEGDLNLIGAPITSLPDNLTRVGGDLFLNRTKITSLPNNLISVGGGLYLADTKITSLPNNLSVGGYLSLLNTSLVIFSI